MSDGISAYKMPLRTIRSPRRRGSGRKNRPRRYWRSGNFPQTKSPPTQDGLSWRRKRDLNFKLYEKSDTIKENQVPLKPLL